MGWGGAVNIFDSVMDVALRFIPNSDGHYQPIIIKALVEAMYTKVNWDDWDTQNQSKYYDDYLIHIMYDMNQIDEQEYQYHVQGKRRS